jgi:hypothetical protein
MNENIKSAKIKKADPLFRYKRSLKNAQNLISNNDATSDYMVQRIRGISGQF